MLVEKVLHGVRKDLVNGNLSPPVLNPNVGPTFQQLTDHILNMAIFRVSLSLFEFLFFYEVFNCRFVWGRFYVTKKEEVFENTK
jgi:hypothetical protein